jgi:excisionase family DNA binding protein
VPPRCSRRPPCPRHRQVFQQEGAIFCGEGLEAPNHAGTLNDVRLMRSVDTINTAVHQRLLTLSPRRAVSGLGRSTHYEYIESGALKVIKKGNRTLIRRSDLEDFLNAAAAD